MITSRKRLTRAWEKAKCIDIHSESKIVFMSDAHRGDGSFSDELAQNRNIISHALEYYYRQGFTYIELGDGNELWENTFFKSLYRAHKNIFLILKKFHDDNRLHMVWGNHDMIYRNPKMVQKHYDKRKDDQTEELIDFMPNLEYHESILLNCQETGFQLLGMHGHQADMMNYVFWKFNRFFVRVFWKPLQSLGFYDPTSPAQNHKELIRVERRIKKWITETNMPIIAGHTHRPRFPEKGEIPFFNSGSGVHPRSITGIEIEKGQISLFKWQINTTPEGVLKVEKELLEGPKPFTDYMMES
jgi:predicted phosphodiesterase